MLQFGSEFIYLSSPEGQEEDWEMVPELEDVPGPRSTALGDTLTAAHGGGSVKSSSLDDDGEVSVWIRL